MLQAELRVLGGKNQGKVIPLTVKKFLVGREQDCHLRPNSELVSRHHCVFLVDGYSVRVRDLGSTNGTRVNGDLIRNERVLNEGDRVSIGKLELQVSIREVADEPVPQAIAAEAAERVESSVISGSDPNLATMSATMELPLGGVSPGAGGETAFELPTFPGGQPALGTTLHGDTAILSGGTNPAIPVMVQPTAPGYPMPGMMPSYPPGYPPPMMPGYPPGYGGYPPPGYAGYPPQPGYPMMPGYPQAMAAPTPLPPTVAPAVAEPAAPAVAELAVKLPPPETTGYKEPVAAPAPPAAAGAAPPKKEGEKSSASAADIIKQYMQRRTGK